MPKKTKLFIEQSQRERDQAPGKIKTLSRMIKSYQKKCTEPI